MAEKRMFTQKIIDSDAFLDMPLSAQALYFHLNMRADDDGFINNPRKIVRYVNASDDDLKLLITKRFVLTFDSGVIVIKHWRMHNTLKSDRYHPTDYQDEFRTLGIKSNKAYTDDPQHLLPEHSGATVEPERNQSGTEAEPQIRLDKNRLDKNSLSEDKEEIKEGDYKGKPSLTSEQRKERIENYRKMLASFKKQGWDPSGVYRLAENKGISRAELESAG